MFANSVQEASENGVVSGNKEMIEVLNCIRTELKGGLRELKNSLEVNGHGHAQRAFQANFPPVFCNAKPVLSFKPDKSDKVYWTLPGH